MSKSQESIDGFSGVLCAEDRRKYELSSWLELGEIKPRDGTCFIGVMDLVLLLDVQYRGEIGTTDFAGEEGGLSHHLGMFFNYFCNLIVISFRLFWFIYFFDLVHGFLFGPFPFFFGVFLDPGIELLSEPFQFSVLSEELSWGNISTSGWKQLFAHSRAVFMYCLCLDTSIEREL